VARSEQDHQAKRLPVALAAVVAACVVLLAACGPGGHEADEAAIHETNKAWQEKIVARDAATIAQYYAEDGQFLPPNAPKAVGREAIQKAWSEMFAIPGVALTFETEKLVFAKSGDLAVDIATYKFSMGEGAAAINDSGKSVVTWTARRQVAYADGHVLKRPAGCTAASRSRAGYWCDAAGRTGRHDGARRHQVPAPATPTP
jgi:uncharacterized protein (TIGR02246 family)